MAALETLGAIMTSTNCRATIAAAVWNKLAADHIAAGSMGAIANNLQNEAFGKWVIDPTGLTMTLYKEDGITVLKVFDLTSTVADVPAFIGRTPQ